MYNEGKSGALTDKEAVMKRLRDSNALYIVVSMCTKLPYVVCNPETFDDEILVFFRLTEAETRAGELAVQKIPVGVVKLDRKQLALFYTNLYTMGVNALLVRAYGKEEIIQLKDFVGRRDDAPGQESGEWVENPALHLTALYYMQALRRQSDAEISPKLAQLQEEIEMHFRKGNFILAIQKEGDGIPLIKMKNGEVYQAAFTDLLEFQKFNREDRLRPVMISADKISQVLAGGAVGVILNPMGINLPLAVKR